MSEAPELLLHHHLKKLRLPTFLSDYEKLARIFHEAVGLP